MKYVALGAATVCLMVSVGLAADWEVYVNSDNVTTIWPGSAGAWWGGSYGGAVHFNLDTEFFQKTLKSVGGLRSNRVTAIAVDTVGAVWIGTAHEGVSINDGGTWRFENTDNLHLLSDDILDIAVRGGLVAVGTSAGLTFFDDGAFTKFFNGSDWGHSGCDSILAVALGDQEALVGTPCGTFSYRFADGTWREAGTRRRARRVAYDGESYFWIVAGDSIYRYDGTSTETIEKHYIESELIRDITAKGSAVWIVTNYGPSKYRPALGTWDHNRNGIPDKIKDVPRVRFADNGTLWIGTQAGAAVLQDTTWVIIKSPGPASNYVEDLCVDGSGDVWFTTGYRKRGPPPGANLGIMRYDPGALAWRQFVSPEITSDVSYACETDPINGSVWFGFWDGGSDGLVNYSPGTSTWTSYRDSLKSRVIPDIYLDAAGDMIFGEYIWGVGIRSRDGKFIHYSNNDGECISSICMTAVGPGPGGSYMLGNYYVSSGEGCEAEIVRLDLGASFDNKSDDTCERWTPLDGYPQGIATYTFALDPYGVGWMGSDGGLGAYDFTCHDSTHRTWYRTNVSIGTVWDVKVDSLGNKWVASDQGLYVLKGHGLEWGQFDEIQVFNNANSPLEDASVKALAFDADGAVWIGTAGGGIYRYAPERVVLKPKSWIDAYPNPYLAFEDACDKGVGFSGVQSGTTVSIYTVAGELVKEVDADKRWDGTNRNGDAVVSGVYIYVGRAQQGVDFKGRLVVVR
ncbi:MAG TPA: two-component regulator propeller domain-containing protein [bacterium]|nr:two-component regulator propeller domain-containing protein [bacterium]